MVVRQRGQAGVKEYNGKCVVGDIQGEGFSGKGSNDIGECARSV